MSLEVPVTFLATADATIAVLIGVGVAAPAAVLLAEILASIKGPRLPERATDRPSVAVLVPAHNEALSIERTLASIKGQLQPEDRLVVVADNCDDETADLASRAGAEVTVRAHAARVGKGFALAAGVDYLSRSSPCAVLIIIDADCEISSGALSELGRACIAANRPAQALYLMGSGISPDPLHRIAEFAWRVKNDVRPTGLSRLRMPCQLSGSGMAFPWALVDRVSFATGHITEDLLLSVQMTLSGYPALFCPSAVITSQFPVSRVGRDHQRRRWIHGQISVAQQYVPALLWRAITRRDFAALAIGADLAILPIVLQAFVVLTCLLFAVIWFAATGAWATLAAGTVASICFGAALLAAWLVRGRDLIGAAELKSVPNYAIRVAAILAAFFGGVRSGWNRANRERGPRS
jgi:cellulose synthase/poly-beta-1,6-N-acetylglucosamine synthase-like glycosyltransferase